MRLYGKVIRCFHDRGFAFVLGEDNNSYFAHYSKLNGEHIERGYDVFFVPFQNDRSDFNAINVTVINAPEKDVKERVTVKKKRNHKKHKPSNASRIICVDKDKKFQRFVRSFMSEQKVLSRE